MALFFLSYDLRNGRNYQLLYDKLKEFNAVRILESTWCFNRVNTSAKGLTDFFMQFIDEDDDLIVSQVATIDGIRQWASFKTDGTPNDLK